MDGVNTLAPRSAVSSLSVRYQSDAGLCLPGRCTVRVVPSTQPPVALSPLPSRIISTLYLEFFPCTV